MEKCAIYLINRRCIGLNRKGSRLLRSMQRWLEDEGPRAGRGKLVDEVSICRRQSLFINDIPHSPGSHLPDSNLSNYQFLTFLLSGFPRFGSSRLERKRVVQQQTVVRQAYLRSLSVAHLKSPVSQFGYRNRDRWFILKIPVFYSIICY